MYPDSSPFNPASEIARRTLYLFPVMLFIAAFLFPVIAFSRNQVELFFVGTLLLSETIYLRHLGIKYWEFLRLDREVESFARGVSYTFQPKTREEKEIEFFLSECDKRYQSGAWEKKDFSLLGIDVLSRHGSGPDIWKN